MERYALILRGASDLCRWFCAVLALALMVVLPSLNVAVAGDTSTAGGTAGGEATPTPTPTATPTATPTPTPSPSPPVASVTITIQPGASALTTDAFGENPLVIEPGTEVTWVNTDSLPHTATSSAEPPAWDSGQIEPGQSFSRTFNEPGTYPYLCTLHPNMTGTIQVGAAQPTPTPTATPEPTPTPSATASPSGAAGGTAENGY